MEKGLCEICNPKQWKTISSDMLTENGYPVYGANGIIGIAIGKPLKLSPAFPPLHTGHATFTASGVPSIKQFS